MPAIRNIPKISTRPVSGTARGPAGFGMAMSSGTSPPRTGGLTISVSLIVILQPHFVVMGLSSLVVADSGAVLVAPAPGGPGHGCAAGGRLGGYVCQETADLAERARDEAAARAFGRSPP